MRDLKPLTISPMRRTLSNSTCSSSISRRMDRKRAISASAICIALPARSYCTWVAVWVCWVSCAYVSTDTMRALCLYCQRTYCHRCCIEYIRRSKWAPSACRLVGSRSNRPWLEALEAARDELLPCCEAAVAIWSWRNRCSEELSPRSETRTVDMCTLS